MKNIRKASNASYRGYVDVPVKLGLEIFQKRSKINSLNVCHPEVFLNT